MKIRNVFVLMAAFALASCSKSEMEETVVTGSDEIVLRSSVVDVATSRVAYEGSISSTNPLTALIAATTTASSGSGVYASLHCYGTMTFNGSTAGTSYDKNSSLLGDYKFPVPGTNAVYLTGLHPATGWTGVGGTASAPTTTNGELFFTLTGKDDVMFATEVSTRLNDVTASTPAYASLNFRHQLTLMKLSLYCDASAVGNIKVQSIQLIKAQKDTLATQVTASLNTTQMISFAKPGTLVALNCYQTGKDVAYSFAANSEYEVTDTAVEQAYVIAPPVTAGNTDGDVEYTFRIAYLDGSNSKTKDVDIDLKQNNTTLFTGSTVNQAFNITLKFVDGEIVTNATVTDWVTGGTFEQEI